MATRARGGRQGLVRDGRDELVLAGIADAHVVDMRSHIDAAVAVKWPAVIASTTYGNAQPRVREVGEALVVAGHW